METRELCRSYTALVFEPTASYRNVHCALCNNASVANLACANIGDLNRQVLYSMYFSRILRNPPLDLPFVLYARLFVLTPRVFSLSFVLDFFRLPM